MISANGWWCYLFILHLWNFYFHLYWHDTDVLQWRGDSKQQRLQLENKMLVPVTLSIPPWFKIFYKRYGYFMSIHGNKLTFWAFVFQHWRRHHHASSVCTLLCGSYTITWIKFGLEIISSGQTELNRWTCHWITSLSGFWFWNKSESDALVISTVIRRQDLDLTITKTNTKIDTKTNTMTNTRKNSKTST